MKISKLLNKKKFSTVLIFFLIWSAHAEDKPVDIWNIEKKEISTDSTLDETTVEKNDNEIKKNESSIYKMQLQNQNQKNKIKLDETLNSKEIKIVGLYDPEDNGLDINLWSNSDGDQLKNIFLKLNKIDLSKDASEIMQITVLTNSYYPNKNITEKEFLRFKSDWMIKNSDLKLIEEYYLNNQIINIHPELIKYLVNQYLSKSNVKKSCDIFSKNSEPITDEYLSKFNIYCLVQSGKKDQAQIIFDLKKELGFKDKYFKKKINFLLGFETKIDQEISEKTILDFHLAHKTNPNF